MTPRRLRILFLAGAVLLLSAVALAVGFRYAGHYLNLAHPPGKADVIVVLAGSYPDRVRYAADLFHQGWAPQILVMHPIRPPGYDDLLRLGIKVPQEWEINREVLVALDVPPAAVTVMDREGNGTVGEALLVRDFCQKRRIGRILLVTSRYHSRRAYETFRRVLPKEVSLRTTPTPYDSYRADRWWHKRRNVKNTLTEFAKILVYQLEFLVREY